MLAQTLHALERAVPTTAYPAWPQCADETFADALRRAGDDRNPFGGVVCHSTRYVS